MRDRFELFTISVTRAYKYIQQIKKHESATFGIKGIHVMCMVALGKYPQGLTVTELASSCCEDKAAISRTVDSLAEKGYITYEEAQARRRWRSKVILTEKGREVAKGVEQLIEEIVGKIKGELTTEQEVAFYRMFSLINDRLAEYCEKLERRE